MADETTDAGSGNDDFDVPLEDQDTAPESTSSDATTDSSTETPAPEKDLADGLSQELTDALYRSGLRPIPGETEKAAYARLTHHLDRRAAAHYKEAQRAKEENRRTVEALRNDLTPMLRDYYAQQRRRAVEDQAAQIPDKTTDPDGYQIWLQEELLRRDEEAREEKRIQAENAKRQAADKDVQERLAAIDEAGYQKVALGLGLVEGTEADHEFAIAYDVFSQSGIEAARHMFPDADDVEIQQFLGLSQQLDIRRAEMNGMDFRDVMKSRLNGIIDGLVKRGLVTRVAAANGAAATAAATGNGKEKPAPAQTTQSTQPAQPTKTTAQRVASDAQAAARRAPAAVPSTTRANSAAGQLPEVGDLDEEAYVEAALAQLLGDEEQRVGGHRRSR